MVNIFVYIKISLVYFVVYLWKYRNLQNTFHQYWQCFDTLLCQLYTDQRILGSEDMIWKAFTSFEQDSRIEIIKIHQADLNPLWQRQIKVYILPVQLKKKDT